MKNRLIDLCVNAITEGTRPIRIFIFGGTFLALFLWMMLANYLDIDTDVGRSIDLPNAILIGISIFIGFGTAFGIVHFADKIKRGHEYDK